MGDKGEEGVLGTTWLVNLFLSLLDVGLSLAGFWPLMACRGGPLYTLLGHSQLGKVIGSGLQSQLVEE